ncbi:hypothetical protein LTR78_008834 [Recurvomyces mirabilis]|uniref:Zn(2)-C6 fungal-type domain-containing protein n=1 Tax=Recurvomyces mirabilis TaxID=574656 RepID=A0AAE0WIU4_9PEZI|nr:hypothetical protein LTR78_008834 [Recurvomyces mirabilis]KAK5155749.1 hypothetical protein LTS14_005315 [Recurvomyces mirabilis]
MAAPNSTADFGDMIPRAGMDRKDRNRTAQRNFRQRQVQFVQDMEDGIGLLQNKRSLLHANNELLRSQLDNLKIENEVLQAAVAKPTSIFIFPQPVSTSSPESDTSTAEYLQSSRRAFVPLITPKTSRDVKHNHCRQPVPRRAHTKSKTGCKTCKLRKVKCDETTPLCNNCARHFTNLRTCDFDELDHTFVDLPANNLVDKQNRQQLSKRPLSVEEVWHLLQSHPRYLLDRIDLDRFAQDLRALVLSEDKALSFDGDQVLALI